MKSDTPLLDALTDACCQVADITFGSPEVTFLDALKMYKSEPFYQATFTLNTLAQSLTGIVSNDRRFSKYKTSSLRLNNGSVGFYPNFVASPLLRHAIETSPEIAIEWLNKVLDTSSATGKTIRMLWGLTVDKEIQFSSTLKLVPVSNVPDCRQKDDALNINPLYMSRVASALDFQPPQAALIQSISIQPLLIEENNSITPDKVFELEKILDDITSALTLMGPCPSLPSTQWFLFDDPDIERAHWISGQQHKFIEILPLHNTQPTQIDGEEAREIINKFLELPGETQNKVKVAIDRLNQSLRRRAYGDRCIELAIAFEALLGDNGNTEMTHKIKVRATRILGGTDDERMFNAEIVGRTYDIRSTLVHTGQLKLNKKYKVGGNSLPIETIVDRAENLCAVLIKKIIRMGEIPDWKRFDYFVHSARA